MKPTMLSQSSPFKHPAVVQASQSIGINEELSKGSMARTERYNMISQQTSPQRYAGDSRVRQNLMTPQHNKMYPQSDNIKRPVYDEELPSINVARQESSKPYQRKSYNSQSGFSPYLTTSDANPSSKQKNVHFKEQNNPKLDPSQSAFVSSIGRRSGPPENVTQERRQDPSQSSIPVFSHMKVPSSTSHPIIAMSSYASPSLESSGFGDSYVLPVSNSYQPPVSASPLRSAYQIAQSLRPSQIRRLEDHQPPSYVRATSTRQINGGRINQREPPIPGILIQSKKEFNLRESETLLSSANKSHYRPVSVYKDSNINDNNPDLNLSPPPFQQSVLRSSVKSLKKENSEVSAPKDEGKSFPTRLALIPFQQKDQVIPFEPFVRKENSANTKPTITVVKLAISRWLAEVYQVICKETFQGYFSGHLSDTDFRVYFTHNVSLNFQHLIDYLSNVHSELWNQSGSDFILHFEKESLKALGFMMITYPQKKKIQISEEMRKAIPACDGSDDPSFDFIRNTGLFFEYDESKSGYLKNVKRLLNRLMTESEKHYESFQELMTELFTLGGEGTPYLLKNKIGKKFKENTPQYSDKEIEEDGLQIKAPQVLRVIVKWIKELENKVRNLGAGKTIGDIFTVKADEPFDVQLGKEMKRKLQSKMEEASQLLEGAQDEMKLRVRSTLSLFPAYAEKYLDYFSYIKPTQVKNGLLTYVLSETAFNLSVNYLVFIIHLLESGIHQINKGSFLNEEPKDLQLVTFGISDLLRCKCSGSLKEIKEVYERIDNRKDRLKVYRVKNRLDTVNRDFLVNAQLVGTPILVEIQLAVIDKDAQDEKAAYLDHFSHFLYQLKRANYGPIAEAVTINSYLTDFSNFFKEELSKKDFPKNTIKTILIKFPSEKDIEVSGYYQRSNNFTFICSNCMELRVTGPRQIPNFDNTPSLLDFDEDAESSSEIKRMLCGDCVFSCLTTQQKSRYLLKPLDLDMFFRQEPKKEDKIICAVNRNSSKRQALVLQRFIQNKKEIFIPAFLEYQQSNKLKLSFSALQSKYYVFGLSKSGEIDEIGVPEITTEIAEQLFFPAEGVDLISVIQSKTDQSMIKLKIANVMGSTTRLALNVVHSEVETHALLNRGRQFKKFEIDIMMNNAVWKLDNSNLESSSFQPLPEMNSVTEIQATKNHLTNLRFITSSSLKKLNLTDNNISEFVLTENDFPNLEKLILDGNNIRAVMSIRHNSLRVLSLQNNQISTVKQVTLRQLTDLNLSHNNLFDLDMGLVKCSSLTRLDLSYNQIRRLTIPKQMFLLQWFSLAHNSLNDMYQSQRSVMSLSTYQNMPIQISLPLSLPNLSKLEVGFADVTQFALETTQMPKLRDVSLQCKLLKAVRFPRQMPWLQKLQIKNSALTSAPNLSSFEYLSVICFENNMITSFDFPKKTAKLERLCLCGNKLTRLLLPFSEQSSLNKLCANRNLINQVVLHSNVPKLESIQLSNLFAYKDNNQVKMVNFSLMDAKFVTYIDISANPIRNVIFPSGGFPHLQTINLSKERLDLASTEREITCSHSLEQSSLFPELREVIGITGRL